MKLSLVFRLVVPAISAILSGTAVCFLQRKSFEEEAKERRLEAHAAEVQNSRLQEKNREIIKENETTGLVMVRLKEERDTALGRIEEIIHLKDKNFRRLQEQYTRRSETQANKLRTVVEHNKELRTMIDQQSDKYESLQREYARLELSLDEKDRGMQFVTSAFHEMSQKLYHQEEQMGELFTKVEVLQECVMVQRQSYREHMDAMKKKFHNLQKTITEFLRRNPRLAFEIDSVIHKEALAKKQNQRRLARRYWALVRSEEFADPVRLIPI
ncbi:unnamed protein product [Agarophyton chilense]|eukprot:gb/GEZJ01001351.1/.p2 GENE.gb/GEZJ01001351.1/~~gb/GEZJ01001351.1/.p2  ORF type:complete len:270 (+),score=50.98 gb/GEZJ01001351.1/:1540-2349(+)